MQLESPKREKMPDGVNDEAVKKAVTQLKQYETQATSYWLGVIRQIQELNATVVADRR